MQPDAMGDDPLANLRDLHLPEAVADWPPALGWWLLSVIFLIVLIWTGRALCRRFKNRAYRRQAQLELKAIVADYNQTQDSSDALIALQLLMKRAAMTGFNRAEVAALTGVAWTQFLDTTSPKTIFSLGPGELLIDGPYQLSSAPSTTELTALFSLCADWIKAHSKANEAAAKPREQTA